MKALLSWNSNTNFHPKFKPKAWAQEEAGKLWQVEQFLDQTAANADGWKDICGGEYVVPANRVKFIAADVSHSASSTGEASGSVARLAQAAMPSWMMADLQRMGS